MTSPDIPSLRKPPNPSGQLSADLLRSRAVPLSTRAGILELQRCAELDARILALQVGEPVMLVRGVTYLDDVRAIEVEESHFRAESIEFIIELGEYSQYARLMPHDLPRRTKSTAMSAVESTASD